MYKITKHSNCNNLAFKGIKALNKIANLPPGTLYNTARFEINGNTEIVAEGCKSILEYCENVIQIDSGKFITVFSGSKLKIQYIRPDALIIQGEISTVEFKI